MKKILLVVVILLMTSALAFAGGKKDSGGGGEPPFVVDLTKLIQAETLSGDKVGQKYGNLLRNRTAFTKAWDGFLILFPEDMVDVSKYQRVTITLKYFDAGGNELEPADSMGQLNFINDLNGDWRGPAMDAGPNTPLKQMNIGGFSGMINKERGVRHGCSKVPGGMIIQRAQDAKVAYIEVGMIVFHNGNFKFSDPQPEGKGPEGS
jgi:hypothetical protein